MGWEFAKYFWAGPLYYNMTGVIRSLKWAGPAQPVLLMPTSRQQPAERHLVVSAPRRPLLSRPPGDNRHRVLAGGGRREKVNLYPVFQTPVDFFRVVTRTNASRRVDKLEHRSNL